MILNKNIFFVCHAQAAPASEGQSDYERPLTPRGVEQAEALRDMIGHGFNVVVTSPTRRTRETAATLAGSFVDAYYTCEQLRTLTDPEGIVILDRMHGELGHAPYSRYVSHADASTLGRFATSAAQEITRILGGLGDDYANVLIVGHGVLTIAIIAALFPTSQVQELMLRTQLNECGAIHVTVNEQGLISAEVFN